jgi:hypothetical protein
MLLRLKTRLLRHDWLQQNEDNATLLKAMAVCQIVK